jgi:putative redox protein
MEATVTWSEGLTFAGSAPSGFSLPLGTDSSVGGANDGFRPVELLALSLAACTAMDVMSILQKKQARVSGFEVRFQGSRQAEHPKVFTAARLIYQISGVNVSEEAVRRAIELSVTKYCPVLAMLSKAFPVATDYEILEETGDGNKKLIAAGTYESAAAAGGPTA